MPVTLVTEDQQQDAGGNLTDVYVITFTVGATAAPFTVIVPQSGDPVAAAQAAIAAKTAQVDGIYGL